MNPCNVNFIKTANQKWLNVKLLLVFLELPYIESFWYYEGIMLIETRHNPYIFQLLYQQL